MDIETMSLSGLAYAVRKDWVDANGVSKVNYAAKPYLDAMLQLDSITDTYGADSAKSVVAYFLSNATTWRGDTARLIKAELKRRMAATPGW